MNYNVYFNTRKLNVNDEQAIKEYAKRLSAYCKISWYCQPAKHYSDAVSKIKTSDHTFLIQVQAGCATPSSEELAEHINQIGIQGISTICLFIGYPFGSEQTDTTYPPLSTLSLSSMSLSTGLAGVVLFEQLYRSYRILNNQPYHK